MPLRHGCLADITLAVKVLAALGESAEEPTPQLIPDLLILGFSSNPHLLLARLKVQLDYLAAHFQRVLNADVAQTGFLPGVGCGLVNLIAPDLVLRRGVPIVADFTILVHVL